MAIFDPKTKIISGYQRTIDEKNKTIVKYFDQIGRLYYGQYKDMSVDVTKDINARCEAVSELYSEIKECELKILFEKGLKLCPNCGKENMLAYAFCFGCGTKFATEEKAEEKADEKAEEVVTEEEEDTTEDKPEELVEEKEDAASETEEEAKAEAEVE